jgi:hypothetical protein
MDNSMDDFQYLVDAERFDLTLTLEQDDEADAILRQLGLPEKKQDEKRQALACILGNLIHGYLMNQPIRYSRRKSCYGLPKRYGKPWFTYTHIVGTIDRLQEVDLIETRNGFRDADGRSFMSRMRPTQRLIDFVGHGRAKTEPLKELIRLKGCDKRLIDYEETAATEAMRERLAAYNELMASAEMKIVLPAGTRLNEKSDRILRENYPWTSRIRRSLYPYYDPYQVLIYSSVVSSPTIHPVLTHPPITNPNHHYWGKISPEGVIFPLEHIQTYRVFNRGSFEAGGRFYSKGLRSYMGLPKQLRKLIHLSGERVVELDYSGLHLQFAYHLKGRDYRNDPYEFCEGDEVQRKAHKLAALILINSASRKKAIQATRKTFIEEKIPSLTDAAINTIFDRLIGEHAFIGEFFLSDAGVRFQNLDSQIMEGILTHFTGKGIPILPLHDSCLIASRHEGELRDVMAQEYRKIIGFDPVIDKKF